MSAWIVLADGGQPRLVETLGALAWMFGGAAVLVGVLVVVILGLRRLRGLE
jgi:hypothetical protein